MVFLDDASPTTGSWDGTIEATNAQKAIADEQCLVYFGTYNSGAAKISMPLTNEAGMAQITRTVPVAVGDPRAIADLAAAEAATLVVIGPEVPLVAGAADAVRERFGFEPRQMIEYKALVGDTSDNIPGVKGIGEKGAKALIEQWGTLDAMLEHLEEIEPKRTRTALENGVDEAQLSHELATIVCDVPDVHLDLDAALLHDYDRQAVVDLFHELEFRSLVNRLPESSQPVPEGA